MQPGLTGPLHTNGDHSPDANSLVKHAACFEQTDFSNELVTTNVRRKFGPVHFASAAGSPDGEPADHKPSALFTKNKGERMIANLDRSAFCGCAKS